MPKAEIRSRFSLLYEVVDEVHRSKAQPGHARDEAWAPPVANQGDLH